MGLHSWAPAGVGFAASALLPGATLRQRHTAECLAPPAFPLVSRELTASGAVLDRLGRKTYPVSRVLTNPWSAFHPLELGMSYVRNAAVQLAFAMHEYGNQVQQLEAEEGEDAPWPRFDMEACLKRAVPPAVREVIVDCLRRIWEHWLHRHVPDRWLFKMTKDYVPSVRRKIERHGGLASVQPSTQTIVRAKTPFYLADLTCLALYDVVGALLPFFQTLFRERKAKLEALRPVLELPMLFVVDTLWVVARVGASVSLAALAAPLLPSTQLLPWGLSLYESVVGYCVIQPGLRSLLGRRPSPLSAVTLVFVGAGVCQAWAAFGEGAGLRLELKWPPRTRGGAQEVALQLG